MYPPARTNQEEPNKPHPPGTFRLKDEQATQVAGLYKHKTSTESDLYSEITSFSNEHKNLAFRMILVIRVKYHYVSATSTSQILFSNHCSNIY